LLAVAAESWFFVRQSRPRRSTKRAGWSGRWGRAHAYMIAATSDRMIGTEIAECYCQYIVIRFQPRAPPIAMTDLSRGSLSERTVSAACEVLAGQRRGLRSFLPFLG